MKNKKSPTNAKENAHQRCMFESPVKQKLSSPILTTTFLLQSPKGARRPAANYLWCFTRTRQRAWLSRSANAVLAGNRKPKKWRSDKEDLPNFPTPLSFSTFAGGDIFQIYGKALLILKLESSTQLMVKIWWSLLASFFTDPTHVTDRRMDGQTELRRLRHTTAVAAVAHKNDMG